MNSTNMREYFEQLIKECLIGQFIKRCEWLQKQHILMLKMKKRQQRSFVFIKTFSKEEIREIVRHTKELKEYSETCHQAKTRDYSYADTRRY